ncbi:MAG: LacI family transcriptional regulator [Comamonadaceae bacterium]|nr:LacI family transcriptional regulator [Burkholderiales bacterium]MEB2347316.1 LacI family transcriptional regulator [Comamonadaceae bacterium]
MAKKDIGKFTGEAVTFQIPNPAGGVKMETFIPWTLVKRGVRRKIITPLDTPQAFADESAQEREARVAAQDSALVRALGMAHHWQRLLDDGRFTSMTEIAQAEGLNPGRASTIARLVHLAPDVVEACLTDDSGIALEHLIRNGSLPLDWQQQRRMIQARS